MAGAVGREGRLRRMSFRPRTVRRLLLPVVAAVLLGCAPGPGEEEDRVIATFRGGRILESDLESWRTLRGIRAQGSGLKRMDAVEQYAVLLALGDEAVEEGLDREPSVALSFRQREQQRLVAALRTAVVEAVAVPPAEIDATLAAYEADRHKPERRQVSYILRRIAPGASPETVRAELEAIRGRLLAGADFAVLATELSESQTRFRGGRLGIIRKGQLPPELDAAVFAVPEGGLTDVLRTAGGFALLRCDAIRPAYSMSVDEARVRVEQYLRRPRGEEAWQHLVAELTAGRIAHDLAVLEEAAPTAVVSRFGEETLSRREAALLLAQGARRPGEITEDGARQILDRFSREALLAAEARRRGLDRVPQLRRELEAIRREALAQAMLDRRTRALQPEATEEALRRHLAARPREFQHPERFRLAVLWQPLATESAVESQRRLAAAVTAIRSGSLRFAAAAATVSAHPQAGADGVLPWQTRPEVAAWGPTALRTVAALDVGEVSDVVQEQGALWVFQLLEREAARPSTFEEVEERVRQSFERAQSRTLKGQVLRDVLAGLELRRLTGERETATPPA